MTITTLLVITLPAISEELHKSITVQGTGVVVAQSNQGKISASVITQEMSADVAITNNGAKVQAIVDALNEVGINGNDIQTSGFRFRPEYKYVDGIYVFDGYKVSNGLSIIVDDNSAMGPVLDLIVEAGVTQIDNVSFSAVDVEELQEQALVKATNDARIKAQILADASNVYLGNAIRIVNNRSSNYFDGGATVSSPPPGVNGSTILPGTSNITAKVTIEYLIGAAEK